VKIPCYVGRFRPHQAIPPTPWNLAEHSIQEYFSIGSTVPGKTTPAIELGLDFSKIDQALIDNPQVEASSYHLNVALNRLIGNGDDAFPEVKPNTIGLLFADHSGDDAGLYGLMFNGRFDGGAEVVGAGRRQGAAVFVETIRGDRAPSEWADQVLYDVIHEIGHMFNLWHANSSGEFMTPSNPRSVYPPPYGFSDAHKEFLGRCDDSDFVRPGGSAFEDRGGLAVPKDDTATDLPEAQRLRLGLRMAQEEFWGFEPVELDITLALAQSEDGRQVRIPNEIDPGYERFQIWITLERGDRRHYEPTDIYCRNARELVVSAERPFKRDITIFGQAGGYTFSEPGRYMIEATLQLGKSEVRSEPVEVSVLPPRRSRFYREAEALFRSRSVARLLFYRDGATDPRRFARALAFANKYPRHAGSAGLLYALGRSMLRHGRRASSWREAERHRGLGREYLRRAGDSGRLVGHRAVVVEELLKDVSVAATPSSLRNRGQRR